MQKKIKFAMLFLVLVFTTFTSVSTSYAATIINIQSWDLVDSGKHLDWGGSSDYQTSFIAGVNKWNNYKSGVIRKDTIYTLEDVKILDYYEVSVVAGKTSSAGTIKFNDYNMAEFDSTDRLSVTMHEIGHALRLAHNQLGDVMYYQMTATTTLSDNDKASYDYAYQYCY